MTSANTGGTDMSESITDIIEESLTLPVIAGAAEKVGHRAQSVRGAADERHVARRCTDQSGDGRASGFPPLEPIFPAHAAVAHALRHEVFNGPGHRHHHEAALSAVEIDEIGRNLDR